MTIHHIGRRDCSDLGDACCLRYESGEGSSLDLVADSMEDAASEGRFDQLHQEIQQIITVGQWVVVRSVPDILAPTGSLSSSDHGLDQPSPSRSIDQPGPNYCCAQPIVRGKGAYLRREDGLGSGSRSGEGVLIDERGSLVAEHPERAQLDQRRPRTGCSENGVQRRSIIDSSHEGPQSGEEDRHISTRDSLPQWIDGDVHVLPPVDAGAVVVLLTRHLVDAMAAGKQGLPKQLREGRNASSHDDGQGIGHRIHRRAGVGLGLGGDSDKWESFLVHEFHGRVKTMNSANAAGVVPLEESIADEEDFTGNHEPILGFVEDFGLAMEGAGLPRAAGRMLAWLLVCDPPEQSAPELKEALQSSTGGVSQNLRMLMQFKFVERVGKRGDRRTYYRVAPHAWDAVMEAQRTDAARFRDLTRKGLDLLSGTSRGRQERLVEMNDFYEFLAEETPRLIERYHTQRGARNE